MGSKKEQKFAVALAIVLLVVGGICYAAFPVTAPETPVRTMFKTNAGKVLFTHNNHSADYGASCADCHHHYEEDESSVKSCSECHEKEISQNVPKSCLDCHEPSGPHHDPEEREGEYTCADCHAKQGEDGTLAASCLDCHEEGDVDPQEKIMNFQKRADAFHTQCIECHKEYEVKRAPVNCSQCHVM